MSVFKIKNIFALKRRLSYTSTITKMEKPMGRDTGKIDIKTLGALLIIWIAVFFLWDTVVVYPLKIFVVLLHEMSHGLAAVITGGAIEKIHINANEGGVCWTRGGIRFIVISAGYMGSLLWGGIILLSAARTRLDKGISVFIGLAVLGVTVMFIRNPFGLIYGIAFGAAMILLGKFASEAVNDFILKVIGLTSMLYAIIDIKSDLISRTVPSSDAAQLAEHYFGTPVMWGIIWIVISLVMAGIFLKKSTLKQV